MDKRILRENLNFYNDIKRSNEFLNKVSKRKCVKASDCIKLSRQSSKKIIDECIKLEKEMCKN